MPPTITTSDIQFLAGGGVMGQLIREKDWSSNPIGTPDNWPQSLRTTLSILLNSKFPMFLFWGPELICFYNDAYRPSLGNDGKHPDILGGRGEDYWKEIWNDIKPIIDQVLEKGEASWNEDLLLPIYRNGKMENTYWTFSYSPVNDETGKPAGVFVTCSETTDKVIAFRQFNENKKKQINERTKELKRLNEILKQSEQRYHLMVEEVQDYAILYLNKEGIIENWNKGAEKIKGYKAEEIIGKSFATFYTPIDLENNLPQYLLKQASLHGRYGQEGWRVRKDGSLFWASVTITAVHNDDNEIIGFSKVTHDLTFKKEADDKIRLNSEMLEQKNKELEKMNKELQSFAYISSHDLQEPLRKIQTFADQIVEREAGNLSEDGRDKFRRMQNAAKRMQTLINDLLAYSRTNTQEIKLTKANLNEAIEGVKEDLKEELLQKNAIVEVGHIGDANIIPFQFHQLMFNLISNSLKFSREDVLPHINIQGEIAKGSKLNSDKLDKNSKYCHIIFSDNGIGFEQQYGEKIFEVFQRLHGKEVYEGTGIGLAIVKKIVDNHKGIITAQGELGKGATFDIYLPVS
jgi:PAS domain S-box-containing protein